MVTAPLGEPLSAGVAHVAHPSSPRRLAINQAGLWLFFFSESFLFGALLAARFYLAGAERPAHLNQLLGLGITSILLLSSVTAYQSEAAIKQGQIGRCLAYLAATILLGLVFVAGVGVEWSTAEFGIAEPYGTAFFAMTGLHASHVVSGIGILMLVYRLCRRGRFSKGRSWGVEAAVKYWHFVDVVWVFFYPALYLVSW